MTNLQNGTSSIGYQVVSSMNIHNPIEFRCTLKSPNLSITFQGKQIFITGSLFVFYTRPIAGDLEYSVTKGLGNLANFDNIKEITIKF